jgi:hypothetical protein
MKSDEAFDFEAIHSAIAQLRAKQIFFVCGAVKSGTTWLQILLDAHPDVSCRGEGHLADRLDPLLTKSLADYNSALGAKNRHIFGQLPQFPLFAEDHRLYLLACAIALLLSKQAKGKSVKAVGEKTPDNIRYLGLLSRLFPQAKFVHIVRDGRDCAVSCWHHNLRLFNQRTRDQFGSIDNFAASFADTWVSEVVAAVRFGEAQPDRYAAIRYEDLIADTENAARGLFAFLGVGRHQDVVAKCCAAASFEQLSGRVRGEENRDSFFRKGAVGDWRRDLGDATKQTFLNKAEHLLMRFGYEPR